MEKILGSCSLLSLYHYYSILLLIIIIPLILVLITTPLSNPLPLILYSNPNNNYSQKSLLFPLSFSFLFRIRLAHPLLSDFLFPYLFSLFLSIFFFFFLSIREACFSDYLPFSSKVIIFLLLGFMLFFSYFFLGGQGCLI